MHRSHGIDTFWLKQLHVKITPDPLHLWQGVSVVAPGLFLSESAVFSLMEGTLLLSFLASFIASVYLRVAGCRVRRVKRVP
jgi:hypothetical protein